MRTVYHAMVQFAILKFIDSPVIRPRIRVFSETLCVNGKPWRPKTDWRHDWLRREHAGRDPTAHLFAMFVP